MSDKTIETLIQYPLAGIIVILVALFFKFLREYQKEEREARAAEAKAEREARASELALEREARSKEQNAMRDYMSVQNELFLQAVKDIREQGNESLSRLAEELKAHSNEVARLTGIVTAHDAVSRERAARSR